MPSNNKVAVPLGSPLLGPNSHLLGFVWRPLVAFWGSLLLEPSWGPLGALMGHLGDTVRPDKAIGSKKARWPTSLSIIWLWKDL
eukprot:3484570-Pyramimonas_sp.AAC.1